MFKNKIKKLIFFCLFVCYDLQIIYQLLLRDFITNFLLPKDLAIDIQDIETDGQTDINFNDKDHQPTCGNF